MSEWKKVKLGEVCEISAGGDRPQIFSNHRTDKCRIPIYSNGIDNEGLYGFTDTPKNNGNAITITGRGANAGTVFYRKDPFLSIIRLLTLTPNSEIINAKYLFYLLKNKTFLSTGSAQPQITVPNISQFEIEFNPDIETQHRIASILSRYDSLIENYQKQIKLLEEAARRLYKEWFIDLRFPGHENTKIVDGLPEGWENKKISDVCETVGGGTPSTKVPAYYKGGRIKWVTPTDITRNNCICLLDTDKKITEEGLRNSSTKMVPAGTILMTSRASVGYFGIADFEVCTNQGFISCIPIPNMQMYLLFNLMSRVDEIRKKAGGSTYLEISKSVFRNFDIVCPSEIILLQFQDKASLVLKKEKTLSLQLRLLTEARDRLLPKLMSGEIIV